MKFIRELDLDIEPGTMANWIVGANRDEIVDEIVKVVKRLIRNGAFSYDYWLDATLVSVDISEIAPQNLKLSIVELDVYALLRFTIETRPLLEERVLRMTVEANQLSISYNGMTMARVGEGDWNMDHKIANALQLYGAHQLIAYQCDLKKVCITAPKH